MMGPLALLAACSGDGSPAPSTSTTTTTAAPDRFARGEPDGVLTIGVLLPRTGDGATLGEPLVNVVEAAVAAVNAAGGVRSENVVLDIVDEASAASVDDLLRNPALDAVIGPASSRNALELLPTITAAGVAACSPTATGIALTGMPDNDLFFRTVPSDALEAIAIARVMNQTGLASVGLVFTDDVYGRPFANAVRQALTSRNMAVVSELAYDPNDDDLSAEASQVVAESPPVIAVIGDTASGGRMVSTLLEQSGDDTIIVTNDAIRAADFGSRVTPAVLEQSVGGVSVSAYEGSSNLLSTFGSQELAATAFAAAAVDCVNLLALGATVASPDDPSAMTAAAIELSVSGSPCMTFADCIANLDKGLQVNYDGPTGLLALDASGDVTTANFDVFGFDENGIDITRTQIQVRP